VTVTGKKAGAFSLLARAEGYADASSDVTVAGSASPYGTISVAAETRTFFSGANVPYPFSITVKLDPATGTTSQQIPADNPL
jgi:hypothetical protein